MSFVFHTEEIVSRGIVAGNARASLKTESNLFGLEQRAKGRRKGKINLEEFN